MSFTYPAMVAYSPNGNTTVKNVSFQVYATSDTGFTTPLAITDPFGVAIPGNILNSGVMGVFPQFQQAQYSTVVLSDAAHAYVWTVPSTQAGAVFAWSANTVYTVGASAINPSGDLVTCTAAHTSTGSYDTTKWALSAAYAKLTDPRFTSTTITTSAASTYTLALADAGTEVEMTSATATTIIVPPNSSVAFPIGAVLSVRQYGTGSLVVTYGAGVTLRAPNGTKASQQYSTVSLTKRGTDEWIIAGDTVVAAQTPLVPVIGAATASVNAAMVNFTPATAGPAATSYVVTASPGGLTGTGTTSPVIVGSLTAGTPYTFTVHGVNAAGNSPESAASTSTTPTAPLAGSIPTSGLLQWHQADQISGVADGASVFYWPDNSGNGRGLIRYASAGRPLLRSTSAIVPLPNTKPVVDFDGLQQYLESVNLGTIAQPLTVFIAAKDTSGSTTTTRVPVNTGALAGPYLNTANAWSIYGGATLSGTGAVTGYNVLMGQFNGATSVVRENAVQIASGTAGTVVPSGLLTVGADAGGGSRWTGQIAEVIVYTRVLSGAEITTVESYLKTKYGTP